MGFDKVGKPWLVDARVDAFRDARGKVCDAFFVQIVGKHAMAK